MRDVGHAESSRGGDAVTQRAAAADPNDGAVAVDGSTLAPTSTSSTSNMFRKFKQLLLLKQFGDRDTEPTLVVPGLLIGSLGAASNRPRLEELRVSHVLCVAGSLPLLFPDAFEYAQLDLADVPDAPLAQALPLGVSFIHRAITGGGCVLVHCLMGRSRSAAMVLGYLVAHHGLTLEEALYQLRQARPHVQPNRGFLRQLRDFEHRLHHAQHGES